MGKIMLFCGCARGDIKEAPCDHFKTRLVVKKGGGICKRALIKGEGHGVKERSEK